MLSPKYKRYADRLRQLIEEGKEVATLERPANDDPYSVYIQGDDIIRLQAWLANSSNIIQTVFGPESAHSRHFEQLTPHGVRVISKSYEIKPIVGLLAGALDDFENGFLLGQEFLVAAEVFDSVLEQAKELNRKGYKDPAAVLVRVVVEYALQRMARAEAIDDNQTAADINIQLWKAGRYPKPKWRRIQSWLDTGNSAAHGEFEAYTKSDGDEMMKDVESFLAVEFHS